MYIINILRAIYHVSAEHYHRGDNYAALFLLLEIGRNIVLEAAATDLKNTIRTKSRLRCVIRFARPIKDGRRRKRLSLIF